MKAKDYSRIVGIAWSESDGKKVYEYINAAVGINANDMAHMIEHMQGVLNQIQTAVKEVNPNYQPHFYDVSNDVELAANYTTAPSINEVIESKMNISHYNTADVEASLREIKQDALAQGIDIDKFPYLSEILDDPMNEQLRKDAEAHYQSLSVKLQKLLKQMQGG